MSGNKIENILLSVFYVCLSTKLCKSSFYLNCLQIELFNNYKTKQLTLTAALHNVRALFRKQKASTTFVKKWSVLQYERSDQSNIPRTKSV